MANDDDHDAADAGDADMGGGGKTDVLAPDPGSRKKSSNLAPALISVQPFGASVVVAIGAGLRVFDLRTSTAVQLIDETSPGRHGNAIRAIAFDSSGKLFTSVGDDKLVKLWDTGAWKCLRTIRTAKKLSQVTFSRDAQWLVFADKNGIVSATPTAGKGDGAGPRGANEEEPAQLLGHCCSILTGLAVSPDNRYIASADRDFKIRVSLFPEEPALGAPEIESFCLGHTLFVTCVTFVGGGEGCPAGFVLSGGGDGMVRLWEPASGKELQGLPLGRSVAAGSPGDNQTEQLRGGSDDCRSVVALAVAADGWTVAVALERSEEIILLKLNEETRRLSTLQRVVLAERAPPTSLSFDTHGRLWLVAGAAEAIETDDAVATPQAYAATEAKAQEIASAAIARVRVLVPNAGSMHSVLSVLKEKSVTASPLEGNGGMEALVGDAEGDNTAMDEMKVQSGEHVREHTGAINGSEETGFFSLVRDECVPGGGELLMALQGSVENAAAEAAKAAEAAELARRSELSKREFTQEERDFRKRKRNDRRDPSAKS